MVNLGEEIGLDDELDLRKQYPRLAEVPFDSDRKLMSTVHKINDETRTIKKAAITLIEIIIPPITTCAINFLFNKGSLILRGFCFIKLSSIGSKPMPIAGKLSVNKLMNNSCTGANGTGKPPNDANSTAIIAAVFPESKNLIAFLILA